MAQGQQGQDNASATDMENLRNKIISEAEEVNEANSQLIKICSDSPNTECDNTVVAECDNTLVVRELLG
jgi:seryl-tRNA synthetase